MIQFSTFNLMRRTNYILFIFIGVICHVSTIIFNFQFSISFGRSGYAVGLSAISFSAALQKDAAPLPNAFWGRGRGTGTDNRLLTADG